jgi:hypothetical protein
MASDDDAGKSPSRRPPRPPAALAPAPAREVGTANAAAEDDEEEEEEDEDEEDEAAAAFAPRRLSTELGAAVAEWTNIPEREKRARQMRHTRIGVLDNTIAHRMHP